MDKAIVFLRDDDVWCMDSIFCELQQLMLDKGIPVIYGVIPARLEDQLVIELKNGKRLNPGLIDIVQHGYSHQNHALPGQPKHEFGPARSFRQQFQDMDKGLSIMKRQFGKYFTPGFIPPYHGYDSATLKALMELEIPLFSAGQRVSVDESVLDLPAKVALNRYGQDGEPLPYDLRRMLTKTRESLMSESITGLVFHHRAIKTEADMRAMRAFLLGLAKWRDQGEIQIVLFSDLLKVAGGLRRKNR